MAKITPQPNAVSVHQVIHVAVPLFELLSTVLTLELRVRLVSMVTHMFAKILDIFSTNLQGERIVSVND